MKWISRFFGEKNQKDNSNIVLRMLFPPIERKELEGKEFFVDYSIDTNLEMVYSDLQDGHMDEMTFTTLHNCIVRLNDIRKRFKVDCEIKSTSNKPIYMVSSNG